MKNKFDCSLWILVARTDINFMMYTIPYLVKMCNFPFDEKVLAIDTAPLSGEMTNRPGIGTMSQLRKNCEKLLDKKIIDRIVDINYSKEYKDKVYLKHFGTKRIKQTHNWKGSPILGYIFCIEECKSDYMLHFDSDMLLYQAKDHNWIDEGIGILKKIPQVMAVRPLSGPPSKNGMIHDWVSYKKDKRGFYKYKFFGSRTFLIDVKHFKSLLPIQTIWESSKNRLISWLPLIIQQKIIKFLKGKNLLTSWELMVSNRIKNTKYFRATLSCPKAWTLHPCDHGPEFIKALPNIIKKIEKGEYPEKQAGIYNLKMDYWI